MLTIKTPNGLDLVLNPPPDNFVPMVGKTTLPVLVSLNLIEDGADLPTMNATGTINWNDGSQPVTFFGAGTVAMMSTRPLMAGTYFISITGHNFRAPVQDAVRVNLAFTVRAEAQQGTPQRNIYGPILPRDYGFPNAGQWAFDVGSDSLILESSVKMLILTEVGERVMEPEYGTNVKRMLFEANLVAIESAIQEEIVRATTRWEPRVELRAIQVKRTSSSAVTVSAIFVSKLTQKPFGTVLNFEQ